MGLAGGGNTSFAYGMLVLSAAVLILLPMFLVTFAPTAYNGDSSEDELMDGYMRMTGQAANTKVSVWPLTGIYTPFTGTFYDPDANDGNGQTVTYGTTKDGWIFGTEIKSYTPSQYSGTDQQYNVYKAKDGVFRYWQDSKDYNEEFGTGHQGC